MIFLLNFVHFEAVFAYSETDLLILKQKSPTIIMMIGDSLLTSHSPMQDVAPSAVSIADAIDAIS